MIIQRWQSVLLFISFVMMLIFSLCSLGQFQLQDYTLDFVSWGIYSEGVPTDGASAFSMPTVYLCVISLLSSILFLIDIFLYRNFRLQKRVLLISMLVAFFAIVQTTVVGYTAIENASPQWSSIVISPFIALTSGIMAFRLIKKDHARLKSYDRLR